MGNKGKIILFLIACILLTGCGKEAETEGPQPEVSADSLVGDRADNYSSMDGIADIDGNVSSPEQSIQCEIMSGNFSRLDASAEFKEHIKNTFDRWAGGETCEIEWQSIDLNGDGIDSTVDPDYAKIWREGHPDLAEEGIYYRKYTEDAMEELTRGEWEEMYEAATGYKVDSELIRREEWRQEKQKK